MVPPFPDLDWLSEGVAQVDADGRFTPRNVAVRRWFPAAGQLSDVLSASESAALLDAGVVELERNGARLRVSMHGEDPQRWLIVSDVTASAQAEASAAAASRLRLLGAIGGSVVHDLANGMGAVLGRAEQLGDHLPPEAGGQLEDMVTRSRDLVLLLGSLARMLEWDPRGVAPMRLHDVARDAVELVRKYGEHEGRVVELEAAADDGGPLVRESAVEAMQAVSMTLLFALRTGQGRVRVTVESDRSGRRRMARICIADLGRPAPVRALAAGLRRSPEVGAWSDVLRGSGHGEELLRAAFRLRSRGGDLHVVVPEAGPAELDQARELHLLWPESRR